MPPQPQGFRVVARTPAEAGARCAHAYSLSRASSSLGGSGMPITAAAVRRNHRLPGSIASHQRDPWSESSRTSRSAPPFCGFGLDHGIRDETTPRRSRAALAGRGLAGRLPAELNRGSPSR